MPAPTAPGPFYKTCPRCGSVLFADMDVCYECLYDFTNPGLDYAGSGARPDALGGMALEEPAMGMAQPEGWSPFDDGGVPEAIGDEGEYPFAASQDADAAPAEPGRPELPPEQPVPDEVPKVPEPAPDDIRIEGERTEYVAHEPVRGGEPGRVPDEGAVPKEDGEEEPVDRNQDAGLFAKPSKAEPSRAATDEVELGVLVRWRGLEMTAGFHGDRIAIGRDRANDIAIASFDVPAFAVEIEREGDGAELRLLAEGIGATLDDEPFDRSTRMAAGQEVELFGARLSLVRMDR